MIENLIPPLTLTISLPLELYNGIAYCYCEKVINYKDLTVYTIIGTMDKDIKRILSYKKFKKIFHVERKKDIK